MGGEAVVNVTYDGNVLTGDSQARERFYDSRGYGQPRDGRLELAPVEAAHLLFRGDLEYVRDERPGTEHSRLDFHEFLTTGAVSEVAFFVYKELRDRGFYLSPIRDTSGSHEFVVYPRGQGPWDDTVAYRVLAVSERETVSVNTCQQLCHSDREGTGVLAVVDEESEVTYLELGIPDIDGETLVDLPPFEGDLLADRVLVRDPPENLYQQAFYGQQLDRDERPLQLSLVEAAHLVETGTLEINLHEGINKGKYNSYERNNKQYYSHEGYKNDSGSYEGDNNQDSKSHKGKNRDTENGRPGQQAVLERGRQVEGDRFDRRLRVYSELRERRVVPKTGFKFGADFRTYADVESAENLGHSELLVRVLPLQHTFRPRDLALDVRLAHGVRKQMVFALTGKDTIEWLSIERLTP